MSGFLTFWGDVFLAIARMSMQTMLVAFFALLLILLFRKLRAPQWINFLLIGFIAFRLVCPVEFPSPWSLYNAEFFEDYTHRLDMGLKDGVVGEYEIAVEVPGGKNDFEKAIAAGVKPDTSEYGWRSVAYTYNENGDIVPAKRAYDVVLPWVTGIWLAGMAGYWLYGGISYWLLLRRLRFAVKDPNAPEGMPVWLSDRVETPCLVGLFRPRIILPFGMNEKQREFALCHEAEHLWHGDHIWKMLGYAIMSVYWWHYWIWGLYTVFLEELEIACDARVLRKLGAEIKADYSEALVDFSVKRRFFSAAQIAFGENYTKERVKNVLRWKQPLLWLVIPALVLCFVVGTATLTSAVDDGNLLRNRWFGAMPENYGELTAGELDGTYYHVTEDMVLHRANAETYEWVEIGKLAKTDVLKQRDNFIAVFYENFDAAALVDHALEVYRITEPGDPGVAWMLIPMDDNRVYLARMDGFMSHEAKITELYRLHTGWYREPVKIQFPAGDFKAAGLEHWCMWSSLSPGYAEEQMGTVTIRIGEDSFETEFTGSATAELRGQLPIKLENVHYAMEEVTEDIPAADGSELVMLPVLEGTTARLWYVMDTDGKEYGWRILQHNGNLYAGYWRPFGEANQTMACVCLFRLELTE